MAICGRLFDLQFLFDVVFGVEALSILIDFFSVLERWYGIAAFDVDVGSLITFSDLLL